MTTLQAYRVYLAIKLHFSDPKYDLKKTKGRINVPSNILDNKPKIGWQLAKLLKKFPQNTIIDYFIANFSYGDKYGGMFDLEQGMTNYWNWKKKIDSIDYIFKQEVSLLVSKVSSIEELWDTKNGHPIILREFLGGRISLETVVLLNRLYKFRIILNDTLGQDTTWQTVSQLIISYSPFLKVEKEELQNMVNQVKDNG